MTGYTWPPEEREEFERLCQQAWESAESTRERTTVFLRLVRDADQAHRLFARDVLRDAEARGAAAILKAWHKRARRVAVSYHGELLTKSRVVGTLRKSEGGWYAVQTLFDLLSFDELQTKLAEYARQRDAYTANIHLCQRLLRLRDLAPGAATPAQACQQLGTTIEAFLAADAA